MEKKKQNQCNFKVGFGYDVHKLSENRKLILGGKEISHDKGLEGHSDADVVIHSICDALLGAAGLRDIGFHFPDNSNEYKDIDSKIILSKTMKLIRKNGYEVGNIDVTVCLEKPKLKNYIPEMIDILSKTMNLPKDNISIKATTTEKLGFIGREEGISASCVALIFKS